MKTFDYRNLTGLSISPSMSQKMIQIAELKGRLASKQTTAATTLKRLVEVAKVRSTDASNRIEGVYTSDTRLNQLMQNRTKPHNRSEQEISGYRDVLDLIHQNHAYIPVTASTILTLHKQLFQFTASTWGGSFKDSDNQIMTVFQDGSAELRFQPPAAALTPILIDDLCHQFRDAVVAENWPTLILDAAFTFDFVSIHPFRDGNGRMSRLLTLLVLYQSGYDIGQYISIEDLIERTKDNYYSSLASSSTGWDENMNNYQPFIDYFLSIILQAYRELAEQLSESNPTPVKTNSKDQKKAPDLVIEALGKSLKPLSKREIIALVPQYSKTSIDRAVTQLLSTGKLRQIGKGRSTKYVLSIC